MSDATGTSDQIERLMLANLLEVFNERNAERRREAIDRTYSEDVVFSDPEELVVGRDAMDGKVQKLLDGAPDFVFSPASAVLQNHDMGYLTWNFGPEGQDPVVSGIDICFVHDGQIVKAYTLLLG